jgi:hypothetical protein
VRIQVTVFAKGGSHALARGHAVTDGGAFETPPLMGGDGPLPVADYRIELLALFIANAQTAEVLRRTDDGRALRGPGMTRDRAGAAAYFVTDERRL